MDDLNTSIVKRTISFLEYILAYISKWDSQGTKLTLLDYEEVKSSELSLGDLLSTESSYGSELRIRVKAEYADGTVKILKDNSLHVPTMVNNVFIVDGKRRIATNIFTNSSVCRCLKSKILFDDDRFITIDCEKGNRKGYGPMYMNINCTDLNNELITVPATSENYEIYRDLLKLTDEEKWRLQIKLDMDSVGDYITEDMVRTLYDLGEDKKDDSIVNKTISAVDADYSKFLYIRDKRKALISAISKTWWKLGTLSLTPLNNRIKSYFKTAQTKGMEIPTNINPLVYDSLRYKISLPANIMYNESYVDLIDASNTPENNNVNIINELNVATSIEGGVIYYSCFDYKTKKQLKLNYFFYLTHTILKCDYWDYDNMKLKSDVGEFVICRRRLKDIKVPTKDIDKVVQLIEPKPDDRLSYTTRRMPLVNMSDSVRVSMGAAMIKQAIQTEGCEPRLVQSGNDQEDIINSSNLIPYNGLNEGTVEKITPTEIFIKDEETGMVTTTTIPKSIIGANDSTMTYESTVKVGDKVTPGQVLATPKTMVGNTYNLGINARAVYMNYLGYTYEDGVVVSQSYANRAMHYSVLTYQARVKPTDQIRDIIKIGQRVKSRDKIITSITTMQTSSSYKEMMQGAKGDTVYKALEYEYNSKDILVPNNTDEGYVVDIKFVPNPEIDKRTKKPRYSISQASQKNINEWLKDNKSDDYSVLPDELRNMTAPEPQEFEGNTAMIISIVVIRVNRMKPGDKSSNTWGGKGEISLILPDECMPRLDLDGHGNGPAFDIIMNPPAVVARKNPSQLYEVVLTKCIRAIHAKVQDLVGQGNVGAAKEFTREFYGDKFINMEDEDFVKASESVFNFAMKVGSYAKIDYETVMKWCKDLGVTAEQNIYVPDVVIYEDKNLDDPKRGRRACTPEYAEKHGIKGKKYELGFVEEPVVCGESYMYKLYHAADYVGKCTPQKPRRGEPLLGRGKHRDEGQKFGEMESWALMAKGATKMITHDNPEIDRDQHLFINELQLAGLVLVDQYGMPFDSMARNLLVRGN